MSKKALLRLTVSGLMCALLPVSQVYAGSGSPTTSGEKKKCLSTGTAKATFSLKADETSKPLLYKVSAAETVCLFYTVETVSAGGRSQTSPVLRRVETLAKVSHSGYLPQSNNTAAVGLLPDPYRGFIQSELQPFALAYEPACFGPCAPVDKETTRKLFNVPDHTHDHYAPGAANAAWESLLEGGFSCLKGKCRPQKRSATATTSYNINPGDELFYYDLSYGRMGVSPEISIYTGPEYADTETSSSVAYWDFGPACGAEACPSGVRPQTSIKTAKGVAGKHNFINQWYHQSNTFLGLPANLRECAWEGHPVSVSLEC